MENPKKNPHISGDKITSLGEIGNLVTISQGNLTTFLEKQQLFYL